MGDTSLSMAELANAMPHLHVEVELKDFEDIAVTPWFSYASGLPAAPLPPLAERPTLKTARLHIRPLTADDLDALYELRQIHEIQQHSKLRGRCDRDRDETARCIQALTDHADDHWYFGAFLQSTGELIGEGGLPSCVLMPTSISGWPEAEFLVKPKYWRQGYGTEMFQAIMESYWDLPRAWRRLQLIPVLTPGLDAGSDVTETVIVQWESHNDKAASFYAKMAANLPTAASGFLESRDIREGREGEIVRWCGLAINNPRPCPKPPVEEDDDDEEP